MSNKTVPELLADIQELIAELRALACEALSPEQAMITLRMADNIEARAREIDQVA